MLNAPSGHLTFGEIASLLGRGTALQSDCAAHAAECAICGRLVERLREILTAANSTSTPPPGECLRIEQIAALAGVAVGAEGNAWMEHVLRCDACGRELLAAAEILYSELRPEEEDLMRQLEASRPAASAVVRMLPQRRNWRAWGAIAAALLLSAGVGAWYAASARNAPERLLAEAYTRQRLIDFRLPDAGYPELARRRGAEVAIPSQLMRAQAELTGKVESGDGGWRTLALLGIANLELLHADAAVDSLDRARKLKPVDADILAQLGAAYGLRGEMEQRTEDYARALEYLGKALQVNPGSLQARFNRALVLERLNLLEDAVAAWDDYLERDGSSRWAAEARQRQATVRARIKPHGTLWKMLSRGPDVLLDPAARDISPDLFLDAAVFHWLAAPLPTPEQQAIRALAEDLALRHEDEWLWESLRESPPGSPLWARMRTAVDANLAGNVDAARLAREARNAALAAHATTFAKRADFEEIYALDRTQQSQACLALAGQVLTREAHSRLAWLGAAARSEEANCLVMAGEEARADAVLAEAVQIAGAARLTGQLMRARGLRIGVNTNAGNPWFTFAEAPDYLAAYWAGALRPNRLHQVSFNLATASQFLGYPNAACAFGEAALRAIGQTGDRRAEALTRARLSAMALSAGQTSLAKKEAALATKFFAADADPRTAAFRDDAALTAADADLVEGDFDAVRSRLRPFENRTALPPTFFLDLRLRRIEAAAAMHDRDWASAYRALDRALGETRRRLQPVEDAGKRAALFEQAAPLYRMRTQVYLEQGRMDRALDSALELFSLPMASRPDGAAHPRPNETWLIYVCLPKRVAVWVVTAQGSAFHWARGTRQELASQIEKFGSLVSMPSSDSATLLSEGRELAADLAPLKPEQLGEGRRIVIVPDGEIASLPFPALPGPDGRPLGLRVGLQRTHRLPPPDAPAGLGGPGLLLLAGAAARQAGLTLPALAEVATEARYVAGEDRPTILSGAELTAAAMAAAARSAAWVHFAGHGYSNAGNGALFLAGSAYPLTSAQILKMDWHRCRLAVLSACWTAAGETRAFANPQSLVEAFLLAGVRGVVAPAWTIDSAAAAEWMREFYAAMRGGAEAATAVRAASRYLAAQPRFERPYYWASFEYFT